MGASKPAERLFAIDLLKALSLVAVVSFHGLFFPESSYQQSGYWLDVIFAPLRFCVPVLFTISFFLLRQSLEKQSSSKGSAVLRQRLQRLAVPAIFWFSGASLIRYLGDAPVLLPLLQGRIFPGAYYLIAMVLLLPLFCWTGLRPSPTPWLWCCAGLHCFFLTLVYRLIHGPGSSPLLPALQQLGRSIPFYWLIYMPLGALLYQHYAQVRRLSKRLSISTKGGIILLTSGLMVWEYSHLRNGLGAQPKPFEYAIFSAIGSVLALFLSLASVEASHLPGWAVAAVQALSRYSLGIFCLNGLISLPLLQWGTAVLADQQLPWYLALAAKLAGSLLLLGVSLELSKLLERVGLKPCVR